MHMDCTHCWAYSAVTRGQVVLSSMDTEHPLGTLLQSTFQKAIYQEKHSKSDLAVGNRAYGKGLEPNDL